MLVRLEVQNYKSFRSRQSFSMEAARGVSELPGNLVQTPRSDLIKAAAIYGHNAAGKTNLLDVLNALGATIIDSARGEIPRRVPRMDSFRLDRNLHGSPSSFEIELLLDEDRYRYQLTATSKRIHRESLEHRREQSNSRWTTLLDRETSTEGKGGGISFGPRFGTSTQQDVLRDTTVPERSIVGHAAAVNIDHARRVFDWFDNQLFFYHLHRDFQRQAQVLTETTKRLLEDDFFKERYLRYIHDADLGIVDAVVYPPSEEELKQYQLFHEHTEKRSGERESLTRFARRPTNKLELVHLNAEDGMAAAMPFMSESSGTRRFMALVSTLLRHGESQLPGTVVIDEIDSSLSPELLVALIRLAHDPGVNPSGTQLIFTTHTRFLLDEPNLLRRDQVWIAEKGDDGGTEVYSLADYGSEVRPNRPLRRQFNAGRFGGIADLGPSLEAIPIPREPLPLFGNPSDD